MRESVPSCVIFLCSFMCDISVFLHVWYFSPSGQHPPACRATQQQKPSTTTYRRLDRRCRSKWWRPWPWPRVRAASSGFRKLFLLFFCCSHVLFPLIKPNILITFIMRKSSLCSQKSCDRSDQNLWGCPGVSSVHLVRFGSPGRGLLPTDTVRSYQIAVCGVWRPNDLKFFAVVGALSFFKKKKKKAHSWSVEGDNSCREKMLPCCIRIDLASL